MARASFFPGRSAHLNADVYRDDISFLGTAFERGARQFPDESFNKCIQEELSPVGVLVVARYWSGEQLAVLTPLSSMARASDFTLLVLTCKY